MFKNPLRPMNFLEVIGTAVVVMVLGTVVGLCCLYPLFSARYRQRH